MRYSGLAVLALSLLFAACAADADSADEESGEEVEESELRAGEWAAPEWSDRNDWYRTTQGSHLIDYDVFMALERSGSSARLASQKNLERVGFVYPPAGAAALADARLPLGVLKDTDEAGRAYVGFTCAACHTGELRFGGRSLLVEGGPPALELDAFLDEVQRSLAETTRSAAKKGRFCTKLGDAATCERRLADAKKTVDAIQARNVVSLAAGPGRLDAFSRILNEVFDGQLGGEKAKAVSQPVSIPQVWDAPRLSCVQTNCSSTNSLTRNIGETLGVFGHSARGPNGITSTAKVANLHRLEKSLESLQSPKWNAKLFGALDETKRARGETLFGTTCASCHTEPYKAAPIGPQDPNYLNETGAGRSIDVWKAVGVPYKTVGTDPSFIEVHSSRMVKDAALSGLFDRLLTGSIAAQLKVPADSPSVAEALESKKADQITRGIRKADGSVSALVMLGVVTTSIELAEVARLAKEQGRDATEVRHELELYRAPTVEVPGTSYRARPLNGIAFTAPFGHVGAWPTLADVLARESERPRTFPVRARSFDPRRVGIDTTPVRPGETAFMFDTTKAGNRNTGHLYGVDLSAADKEALLEYLKSI